MYRVSRLIGGGTSYWYLFAPCGRIVDQAHERYEHEVDHLHRIAAFLNTTLKHDGLYCEAA